MSGQSIPTVPPRRAVCETLRRMAGAKGRLDLLQADMERELEAVRRRYRGRLRPLEGRLRALGEQIEALCRAERDQVFPDGRKSFATAHGEVGFRKAEPAVALAEGMDEAAVCRLLRKARLGRLVRVKQRPDRASIRKALAEGNVDAARLRGCGVELVDLPDHFRCRLGQREARLSRGAGGTAR